jgi:hypothetical protein
MLLSLHNILSGESLLDFEAALFGGFVATKMWRERLQRLFGAGMAEHVMLASVASFEGKPC